MVPAYPCASHASSSAACGVGLGSVIPHARNPSSLARSFNAGRKAHGNDAGASAGLSVAPGT